LAAAAVLAAAAPVADESVAEVRTAAPAGPRAAAAESNACDPAAPTAAPAQTPEPPEAEGLLPASLRDDLPHSLIIFFRLFDP